MGMRLRMVAWVMAAAVLTTAGCGNSSEALSRHFQTTLPTTARVVHFQGDAFKDPWFVWEIAPVDRAFVNALVANARLALAPAGMDRGDPTARGDISWWPVDQLPTMPEVYFRDPGPTDGSIYRLWVDPQNNRMFLLFMNT